MSDAFYLDEGRCAIAAGVLGLLIGWKLARLLELKNPDREWTALGAGAIAFATCGWIVPMLFSLALFLVPAWLAINWWISYSLTKEQQLLDDQVDLDQPESALKIDSQTHPRDQNVA